MINYIKESYEELKNHVTWISLAEAQRLMVVVVVFTVLFSLLIWAIDSSFEKLMGMYFNFMKK
ncbi:preprotein translocase subunit SecE [Capnocytophaga canimorsus]|uniref:preprotein translocase subunit SecE n=1 Tax=Capnocytophaga canimorsus TaxID=28188 RepID=UPI000D6E0E01|nr:preprotein translocase subunit SecE [Capnocytophaga canimorsus]AWL78317.1 preprotein translocase subunit SecE [Capnocytophaga canimorsus]AYW36942.1 preprotein translocase subunit SecE [Capnocytophaga canimorsus]MDT9499656.1 preprotein translocase subunit SecE [Capnocytophaga canimorsus]